jgi:hypothetical protein
MPGLCKGYVSRLSISPHFSLTQEPHSVKLMSGSLSHENPGNQFGHAAPIFTILLLIVTAVMQIICLNRGLKVYDSTLVVPVFYGVYTATGCVLLLSELPPLFNDRVQILRFTGKDFLCAPNAF